MEQTQADYKIMKVLLGRVLHIPENPAQQATMPSSRYATTTMPTSCGTWSSVSGMKEDTNWH